jgi:uncharacterized membrane protein YcaP (DUF421 family)
MLSMTTSPLEIMLRVIVIFAFLFVIFRIIGKRHVGELAPFDLIVLLMLSESVHNAMMGDDKSLTGGVLAAGTVFGMSQLIGYISWRRKSAARVIEGRPKVLVRHGVVNEAALAEEQITRSELAEAIRKHGITSLSKVRYAVLENDGVITVGKRFADDEA